MQYARFLSGNSIQWGLIEGDYIRSVCGNLYEGPKAGESVCAVSEARILAPVDPYQNKIVGIAANYGVKDQRDGPGIFMKQPGTVVGTGEPIIYPKTCISVIHEAEVAIVIGRSARKIKAVHALDYVMGYTCANDVSAKDLHVSDIGRGTSMRVKHFDTFFPIGPFISTGLDGDNLNIQCRVNGKTEVNSSSSEMIWPIADLISWVSEVMELHPGDVISSGCPDTNEINVGDTVEVEIEGIGTLRNPVVRDL